MPTNPMPAKPRQFQVGDRVKCVDFDGANKYIRPGETYVIAVIAEAGRIQFEGFPHSDNWDGRFVLASPAPEETGWREVDRNDRHALWQCLNPKGEICQYMTLIGLPINGATAPEYAVACQYLLGKRGWTRIGYPATSGDYIPRTAEPAAEGKLCPKVHPTECQDCRTTGPSPVKADKADPYAEHRKRVEERLSLDNMAKAPKRLDHYVATATDNEPTAAEARKRNLAALRQDLDSSSAKRRAALGRRFDGRAGIDLEQAWSTPGDES